MDEIEVIMQKHEEVVLGIPGFVATVPILKGSRKAAGLGHTPEEALTNLIKWLAGAATTVDLHYGESGDG